MKWIFITNSRYFDFAAVIRNQEAGFTQTDNEAETAGMFFSWIRQAGADYEDQYRSLMHAESVALRSGIVRGAVYRKEKEKRNYK